MTDFLEIARRLEMQHNDVKWYASVDAMERALRDAYELGQAVGRMKAVMAEEGSIEDAYEQGVKHGQRSMNPPYVRRGDDYAPPVGPVVQNAECRCICASCVELRAAGYSHFAHVLAQPDGDDGRFPSEAE